VPTPARIRSTIAAIADPPEDLREMRSFYKALGDVTRLRMVRRLAQGPATVTDLIEMVDLSQPLVSWHLRTLRATGLVETRRAGREVICSLRREAFERYARRQDELLSPPASASVQVPVAAAAAPGSVVS
jgi:DNA-binding transcriptional ArsR family regulator